MAKDATSTGSLAQTFLRKAATPVRRGEEGHPRRGYPGDLYPSCVNTALEETPRNLRTPLRPGPHWLHRGSALP